MQIINALVAGIAGAESGFAEVYKRGTATRAAWYAEFEGDTVDSSGADIPLSAYGSAEVYVNEPVDVRAKDLDGVEVRFWTEGASANVVEYIGAAFTGTPWDGGPAAVSEPQILNGLLTRWLTNNEAIDWKVLFEGTAQTLPAALGALTRLVFNVQDPAYGAVGDSTTDDTAAIQAALDATSATSGGIVYLPPGIYTISSSLTVPSGASIIGAGRNTSILRSTISGSSVLGFDANQDEFGRGGCVLAMFGVRFSGVSTTIPFGLTSNSTTVSFYQVDVQGRLRGNAKVLYTEDYQIVTVHDCRWESLSADLMVENTSTTTTIKCYNCVFENRVTSTPVTLFSVARLVLQDCKVTADQGAGAITLIDCLANGSTDVTIKGCTFVSRAADSIGFLLPDFTDGDKFDESDNTFLPVETMISWPVTSAAWSGDVRVTLGSRDGRTSWATQAGVGNHTFSALSYATGRLSVTAGAGPGYVYMEACPPGTLFSGWLANSSGAPINVTVTGLADTTGAIAVPNASRLYWHAVSIAYFTEPSWLIVNIFVL